MIRNTVYRQKDRALEVLHFQGSVNLFTYDLVCRFLAYSHEICILSI